MSADQGSSGGATHDWDTYWRNALSAPAFKEGGPQDQVLQWFWSRLFKEALAAFPAAPKILDVACGNGAVIRIALEATRQLERATDLDISGLDSSPAALIELRRRHPEVFCIAADLARPPFQEGAFDVVTSQFGVEYAGVEAITETAHLVAPGGIFAAVLHLRDGGIFRECTINLEAIDGFRDCGLLRCFEEVYRTALAVHQRRAEKADYERADRRFAEAVKAAEDILRRRGRGVATGTLYRIYCDIGHMYQRLGAYEPQELFEWIDVTARELDAYSGRMSSMLGAALDARQMKRVLADLEKLGLGVRVRGILKFGRRPVPCAWVIVAENPGRRGGEKLLSVAQFGTRV